MNTSHNQEVTRGFVEDVALRELYEKEGFGLETAFERKGWAKTRMLELKETYNLNNDDIHLVKHISSPETGKKVAWEVFVRDGKGLDVLFL